MDNGVYDIFVLEDSPERIKWFQIMFGDCNIFFTDDIETACGELRTKHYDFVFMDRDLGHPRGESGEDVAWVMKEEKLCQDSCVIVHTVNPHGQRNIRRYLGQYHSNFYVIDFTKLRKMKRKDFGMGEYNGL